MVNPAAGRFGFASRSDQLGNVGNAAVADCNLIAAYPAALHPFSGDIIVGKMTRSITRPVNTDKDNDKPLLLWQ